MVDALARVGDEGRGKLRPGGVRMGQPIPSHVGILPAEYIGRVERTGGSEPSQYPQEEKAIAILWVAASEKGTA